jgi:hypothetical protein
MIYAACDIEKCSYLAWPLSSIVIYYLYLRKDYQFDGRVSCQEARVASGISGPTLWSVEDLRHSSKELAKRSEQKKG